MSARDSVRVLRLFALAIETGEALPPDVRPFFVAELVDLRAISPRLWALLAATLEVRALCPSCRLLIAWGKANRRKDDEATRSIEARIDAAGDTEKAFSAVRAGCEFWRRVDSEIPALDRGVLH